LVSFISLPFASSIATQLAIVFHSVEFAFTVWYCYCSTSTSKILLPRVGERRNAHSRCAGGKARAAKRLSAGPTATTRGVMRRELGCTRLLILVFEIPADFEYIDLGRLGDRLQVAQFGGYPTRSGTRPGRGSGTMSHNMDRCGMAAGRMTNSDSYLATNRLESAPNRPHIVPGLLWPTGCTQKLSTSTQTIVRI